MSKFPDLSNISASRPASQPIDLGIDTSPRATSKKLVVADDRIEAKIPTPPARQEFDLSSLYSSSPQPLRDEPKPKGFLRRVGAMMASKFGASILVAVVFAIFKEMALIRKVISLACAIVLGMFGWKVEPPKEEREEAGGIIARAKELAGKVQRDDEGEHKPGIIERARDVVETKVQGGAVEAAKKKAEEFKEDAGEKAKDVVVKPVQKAADKVENAVSNIGSAIGNTAKGAAAATGTAITSLPRPVPRPMPRPAYNAACPNCNLPLNLPASAHKMKGCLRCGAPYMPDAARAVFRSGRFGR